jgi:peptidoglycan biosynthesis protein MviN/MurJ (putative lipid II flippase)
VTAQTPFLVHQASVPRSSAVVSASLFATALIGAGQALVIAFIVGEGEKTDAFLAAYALYFVFALFGASLRSSIVPLIGSPQSDEQLRSQVSEVTSRVLVIGLVALVGLIAISPVAGQALTYGLSPDARWTAVLSLVVLAPAAFFQIHAAALSASLAAARRFTFSALLYVVAGTVGLGFSAALLALIGVIGAAFGLLIGAALLALGHSLYLHNFGVRLHARAAWIREHAQRQLAMTLLAGAGIAVAVQMTLAISLAAVSNDPGAITAYTYAFFIVALMLAISSGALALVTLPDLVTRIEREGAAAAEHHLARIAPYAFAVLAPLLFLYAAYGEPLLEAILADSLSGGTVSLLYDLGLLLEGIAVPIALMYLVSAVTLATGRSRWFLGVGLASVLAHAAIVFPVSTFGPRAVAGGHIASALLMAVLLMAATYGRRWWRVAVTALWRSMPAFALSTVTIVPRLLLGSDPSAAADTAAACVAALAYVGLVFLFWPSVTRAFKEALRQPLKAEPRTSP